MTCDVVGCENVYHRPFGTMSRRDFIAILGGALVINPVAARSEQPPELRKIGFVYPAPKAAVGPRVEAMMSGMRVAGFASSVQVDLVIRTADGDPSRIHSLIQEILAENVSLIIANGPLVLNVARRITAAIPIVALDLESDPVGSGIAASLGRPGGNITGVFLDFPEFTGTSIELLVESNPQLSRIAVLWDPNTGEVQLQAVKESARSLRLQFEVHEVRVPSDFDQAFSNATRYQADAMVILSSPLIAPNVQMLAELALRRRLPAVTLFPDFARTGGLLAYGPNLLAMYRRIGVLAGKVLAGAAPADISIERPIKFELVLNLRTATALGVRIPPSLLLRADEVIE